MSIGALRSYPNMKSLRVDNSGFFEDDKHVALLVRRRPSLIRVRIRGVIEETMKAL